MIWQTFIFGLISFQIIYVIMQWYFFKRKEFIYYLLYLLFFLLYQYAYYEPRFGFTNFFDNDVEKIKMFTRIDGLLIFYSYVVFSRYFTNASLTNASLNSAMQKLEKFLLIGTASQIIFVLFVKIGIYGEYLSWVFYIPSFIYGLVIGVGLIKQKVRLNTYIIVGSLFAILGAFLQGIFDDVGYFFKDSHHNSNFIMETGFVLEFIFLNIGFMYKNKVIQQQQIDASQLLLSATLEKNEIANQLQTVRAKLAMDLHDDVNSSLGSIRIVSEIMTKQLANENDKANANKILITIQELSQKMNVIVWSIIEANDTLQCFIDYTKNYANDFTDTTKINCVVNTQISNTGYTINGNVRKNLFLCIKEAMNNTLKYAKASHINISIELLNHLQLKIIIADDGIGFLKTNAHGNGLTNMKKRMNNIGGTFEIVSNNGTCIVLCCDNL